MTLRALCFLCPVVCLTTFYLKAQPDSLIPVDIEPRVVSSPFTDSLLLNQLPYHIQQIDPAWTRTQPVHWGGALPGLATGINMLQGQTGVSKDWWISLRGPKSLYQSQVPLIVVDGIPVRQGWDMIAAQDLQKIEILTSGLGAALYGSQGQNGVVMLETRSTSHRQLIYTQTLGIDVPRILMPFQQEYGQGYNEYDPNSVDAWGPPLDGREVAHWSPDPAQKNDTYTFRPQYDFGAFVQNGHHWSHHLAFHSSGKHVNNYFSLQHLNASGLLPTNDYTRYAGLLRQSGKIGTSVTWQTKIHYIMAREDNQLAPGSSRSNSYRYAYLVPPNIENEDLARFEYMDADGALRQNHWAPGSSRSGNPYWALYRNTMNQEDDRLMSSVNLQYQIKPYLKVQLTSGFNMAQNNREEKLHNDTYLLAPDGRFSVRKVNAREWINRLVINHRYEPRAKLSIHSALGITSQYEYEDALSANTGAALIVPNFFNLQNSTDAQVASDLILRRQLWGVYGWSGLDWDEKVWLEGGLRTEWSSSLAADLNPQYYPSIATSWWVHKIISLPDWINAMKARGGWSKTGMFFPPFITSQRLEVFPDDTPGFLKPDERLYDALFKPEMTFTREWGLDFELFDQRMHLAFTSYHAQTKNHLLLQALPVGSGGTEKQINGGRVTNRGIELSMGMDVIRKQHFQWQMHLNLTRNRNQVTGLTKAGDTLWLNDNPGGFGHVEGYSWGQVLAQWSLERDANGRLLTYGDGFLRQTGGWQSVGSSLPDWIAGLQQTIQYGRWKLLISMDMRKGGTLLSMTDHDMTLRGISGKSLIGREDGLVIGQDVLSDEIVLNPSGGTNQSRTPPMNFWSSTTVCCDPLKEFYHKDATNARLRQMILSYTLPFADHYVKLSAMTYNLIYLVNKARILDPEVRAGSTSKDLGLEFFAPPPVRSFSLQVELGL